MLINGIFCFLVYLFVVRLTRHTRLLADRIAGKILGQQNILRALRKIETEVAEYDKQIMGRALHFFLNEPSIDERAKRIANEKPALL